MRIQGMQIVKRDEGAIHHALPELLARPCRAYIRRFGKAAFRPNSDLSGVEHSGLGDPHDHVDLRNVRGELARYWVTQRGLRFVEGA